MSKTKTRRVASLPGMSKAIQEAPSTKLQAPEKPQNPSSKTRLPQIWSLKFDASLVLGAWSLQLFVCVGLFCLGVASFASAQPGDSTKSTGLISVATTEKELVIESKGGPVSYKAVVDRKQGGDIKQLCLPADSGPAMSDLNDIFFYGRHEDEYTLRGWSALAKCILSSSAEVVSRKPDEIVVQVDADAAGTFKVISTNQAVKARLAGKLRNYQEKTVKIKRLYAFKPDRIEITDEILWVHPGLEFNAVEWTASFLPGCVQSPARLVKGAVNASFYPVGSGGAKLPQGITYPFTAENFCKNGWKVSLLTTGTSFDVQKSDLFFYEKPWQQDWNQTSGFKYDVSGQPQGKPVTVKTELVFAKATAAEMPPVVTIRSPGPEARWMDEKGEVGKYQIGETVNLLASAVNADGSPVPDKDISWEIRLDAWWKRRPFILEGPQGSYTIPEAANEEEKEAAAARKLLAVIKLTAKGKNGREATEHFAMLVENPSAWDWTTASPESQGISARKLKEMTEALAARSTSGLLVIRNDKIVCEWYAPGADPAIPHGTASMAKAIVGGVATAVAITDGRLALDDRAAKFIPQWQGDPRKSRITFGQLGSHTSGLADAEAQDLPHEQLSGWQGDFWKRLNPPHDPFTIARDLTPTLFEPGAGFQYSNPGIGMLVYALTAALKDAPQKDIRTLLRERVMRPIGASDAEWTIGYNQTFTLDGLPLVAAWGGGNYTARAVARIGRLMLRQGDWNGKQLLSREAVRLVTSDAGTNTTCGIGWWSNHQSRCAKLSRDAFWGSGAGHQVVLVVPSLNLIAVRNGRALPETPAVAEFHNPLYQWLFEPLVEAVTDGGPSVVPRK